MTNKMSSSKTRTFTIITSLIIALLICVSLFFLVHFKFDGKIKHCLNDLYIVYVVSGFAAIWLIILAVLRYSLSKRHNS